MEENELEGAAREVLGTPEDQLAGHIKQAAGQAQQAYGTASEGIDEYVQRQPLTALLVAAGIGFLLGALLVRR